MATDAELGFYCQRVEAARAEVDSVRRRDFLATPASRRAQICAYSGLGKDALTLAQQAAVRPDRLSSLRKVRILLQEARAQAELGNTQAIRAAIGRAENEFAAADPAESSYFANNLCLAELAGDSGSTLYSLALREHRAAAPSAAVTTTAAEARLRDTIATYPATFARSRTLANLRLATLLMRTGDPAEAAQLGHHALGTIHTMQSARIMDSIRDLHRAATRHRGNSGVENLRRRAAQSLAG